MVESARFTAIDIASEADTERLQSYGQNLDYYIDNNYTYIPMPEDDKYYDRDEGVLKDIDDNQWVDERSGLDEVLEKLQNHPFLLVKKFENAYFNPAPNNEASPSLNDNEDSDGGEQPNDRIESKEDQERGDDSESGEDTTSIEVEYTIKGPEEVTGDLVDDPDSEIYDDMITAKEYFQQYPELANEELGSLYDIITLADLNRRTVKQIAYPSVAELADVLSQQIQSEYPNPEPLYPQLKPATIGNWIQNKEEGLDVHIAEYMNLMEMKQIIVSSDDGFVEQCGFESKTKCRNKLGSINQLRKKIMHANRTLIHNEDDLHKTLERIETAQEIVDEINN
ncbi:hypothetical protein HISP_15995 [Haloarcula hispanica N601]|uniref:Uncharacterized protein n=2 Tax=Haloarcula hispanica TaxID=51589 RepID=V5TR72_HALHI|nr:hypothetical protein [Haloarcula hispanica]AEM58716.1 conserved hypothetical protein [Haloarcula hispanica ATCC 33960]AHB67826.1 hypothetical protein HISP_15995 [Haloarcula hispanica N601]